MRSISNYSSSNNNNNRFPLAENNNQLDGMDTPSNSNNPNNSNRQFFLRNASLGSRENTNPTSNYPTKPGNNMMNANPDNVSVNGKAPFYQQNQNMKGSFVQQVCNTQPGSQKKQQSILPPAHPSRKKIFDDDAQSVSSLNTLKQHQYPQQQQQQQMQQQQVQQQEVQVLPQQSPIAPSLARQLQYPPGNEGRQDDKSNESELVKWQRMYSEQQFQLSQLQKAKQTADETHELEIEDTKKHFQFKLDESIKKQQELVIKMQQLQQASVAANNSLKQKEAELQAKSEQLLQATQELQARHNMSQTIPNNNGINFQLQEQKNELERIIADGKIYIERLKNENNQKTELVHQLDREKKALEAKNALLAQQLEQAQKSCATMRQEIDKLIASNQDVARRLEIERRERAEGQFQTKGQQLFRQGNDDRRAVGDLEVKMVQLLDKNQQLSAERSSLQVIIGDLERQLADTQAQLTASVQHNANSAKPPSSALFHARQPNQPLPQITEELDEEMNNYLMLSRKAGNDMYALDLGELRQLARSAQEEAERLRAQLNAVKSQQFEAPSQQQQIQKQLPVQFLPPPQQQIQQLHLQQQQQQQQQVQQHLPQQQQPQQPSQQQFPVTTTTVVSSRFPPSLLKPKTGISATPIQSVYVNHNTLPDSSPLKGSGIINTTTAAAAAQMKPNSSQSLSSLSLPSQQILSSQQSTDEQINKQQQRSTSDLRNLGHFTSQPITTTTIVSNQPNTNNTHNPSITPISYVISKPSEVAFQQQQQQQQFQQPATQALLQQRPPSSLSQQQIIGTSPPGVVSFAQLQFANTQQQQQQSQHQYSYEHNSGLKPARIMEGDHQYTTTTVASAYGHRLSLPPQSR